jgi:malonate transporter
LILTILEVVLPVFLVIGAGYAATRSGLFSAAAVDGLMVFTQSFAIPCLLFVAILRLDLGAMLDPGLLISFYAGAVICFVLGIIGARTIFGRRPGESVAIGFSALFSNSVLLGLPIMERAYGAGSLAPNFAIIALHVPVCYFLGITAMEFSRADGRNALETARTIARALMRNALMLALAFGLAFNVLAIPVPDAAQSALDMLSRAALPAALFGLGGILTRYALRASLGESGMILTLSLVLHPAIGYALAAHVFDLPEGFVRAVVVTSAMAPGVNTYIFASIYGRGQAQAASAVLLGTGLSVLTASAWLAMLGGVR